MSSTLMEENTPRRYTFGGFLFDTREKTLKKGSRQVSVTPKALEILIILVENAGNVISKEDLFQQVWAETFVEDANLTHHISRLRRALGESDENKFIETLPKRGYRFVQPVQEIDNALAAAADPPRRRMAVPLVALGVLAVLLGLYIAWGAFATRKETLLADSPKATDGPMSISRITNVGKVGGATISPDGKFVAYIQNYELGEGMLYVRQVETNTEAKLLAPDERLFGSISFSPDSSFVYYITYDKRDPGGALYRIPVLGGQPTRLLGNVKFMFSLSPDGKRVAFFRDDPEKELNSLIIAALDGSGEQNFLTRTYDEMIFGVCPAWSADGKLIAFGAAEISGENKDNSPRMNVFAVETETGVVQRLSKEALVDTGKMSWMPDGSGIVFIGKMAPVDNQIYFLSFPAGSLHRITRELSTYGNYGMGITKDGTTLVADLYERSSQLWAVDATGATDRSEQLTAGDNDGSRALTTLSDESIVYSARAGDDFDLWQMSDKNRKRQGRPLTADAFDESEVCSTPDDRFLVFASDRAGSRHIFRINTDGSGIKQLTFGDSFDDAPDCAPDGGSIVYASQANGRTLLRKISIDGGDTVPLSDFEANAPTFSPDGKMVACIRPSESVVKPATLAVIPSDGGPPLKMFPVVQFAWSYRAPRWSPGGDALIFSKTESSVGNLWKQNLSDGTLSRVTDFKSDTIFNYVFSRDGKRLIIARGKYVGDVVVIKNFIRAFESPH